MSLPLVAAGIWIAAVANSLHAQAPDSAALARARVTAPLAFGIRVGDRPRVAGLRLNYRDDAIQAVYGANVTIWDPRRDSVGGNVYGLALGLPMTQAARIDGVAIAGLGFDATDRVRGVMIAPLASAERAVQGIALGGLLLGVDGHITGIAAAPLLGARSGLTGARDPLPQAPVQVLA